MHTFSIAQLTCFYFKLTNVFVTNFLKISFITICDNYQENENKKKNKTKEKSMYNKIQHNYIV